MRISLKWKYGVALALASAVTVCGLWFAYAPAHWMTQVSWATVTIDDQPAIADVYIGNPTKNEAEAFLLVHVSTGGDYILNFDGENYREASRNEFVRVSKHAWTFKSMDGGHFTAPLPPQNLNQFRISSRGHIVTVQF